MEDIYTEIDATETVISGEAAFTLTDADYETLELGYGSFSSIDDAKAALPAFLTDKFPAWGAESLAAVTFNLYSPIKFESYTVTDADYTAIELTSLNDGGDFNDFFGYKYPSEARGTVVDLTFNTQPTIIDYTLTDDDFDLVGNGRYDNFDVRTGRDEEDIEVRRAKIQTILLNNFPDAADATKYNVTYEAYGADTDTLEMLVQQQQNEPNASLTTNYTLTDADFELVGNGNYNNFDVRAGRDEETVEARRVKIETILLNNFPATAAGDLYNVTYAIYDGSAGTLNMLLEFDGDGYTLFSTTSYEFYTFVLEESSARFTLTDEWAAPVTFTNDEYSLMGQRYPNFSDNDEAIYKIGIYLRTLYQFASSGDFVAVEYKYYSGGVSQRSVNYVFDGSVWNSIDTVIEETIKFGHDGASWVPDNTIKYTLTSADYTLVGNGNYGNFDVRAGKAEAEESVRLEKVNTILLNNFPSDAEGQKYIVTFNVYNGANGVMSLSVIKEGSAYVKQ
jgi:hypothetical protein